MLFQTSARTMLSAEYTVTGDDVTAYFDYVCRRTRRSALLLGGGFGLLIALTTGLVLVWLSGEPVVGAIGGTIPGALIIGNALRDLSRDALRRELARWNVLNRSRRARKQFPSTSAARHSPGTQDKCRPLARASTPCGPTARARSHGQRPKSSRQPNMPFCFSSFPTRRFIMPG